MEILDWTTIKFGQVSLQMMDQLNIWNSLTSGQKVSLKREWRLTKDGLWTTRLTDKISLTSRNPLTFSLDRM